MDFRVLLASFALVFLAELGDKTQLTALAFTTSSRSPWMVFFGTSLALVAASGMAVLFGEALNRIAVVQKYLPIISGAMFILMGLVLLINVARKVELPPTDAELPEAREDLVDLPSPASGGALFSLVVSQAAMLEEDVLNNLRQILDALPPGREKQVLTTVVKEDAQHLDSLKGMGERHAATFESRDMALSQSEVIAWRGETEAFGWREAADSPPQGDVSRLIRRAVEMEESLANSYLAFARLSKVHAVRDAFRWLAMEDLRHAHILCDLINPPDGGGDGNEGRAIG